MYPTYASLNDSDYTTPFFVVNDDITLWADTENWSNREKKTQHGTGVWLHNNEQPIAFALARSEEGHAQTLVGEFTPWVDAAIQLHPVFALDKELVDVKNHGEQITQTPNNLKELYQQTQQILHHATDNEISDAVAAVEARHPQLTEVKQTVDWALSPNPALPYEIPTELYDHAKHLNNAVLGIVKKRVENQLRIRYKKATRSMPGLDIPFPSSHWQVVHPVGHTAYRAKMWTRYFNLMTLLIHPITA